jgi:hypothetical protein
MAPSDKAAASARTMKQHWTIRIFTLKGDGATVVRARAN